VEIGLHHKVVPTTRAPKGEATTKAGDDVSDQVSVGHTQSDFVPPNLRSMLEAASRPYYDELADEAAKVSYYQTIDLTQNPQELFDSLGTLVRRTHTETLSFKPQKYLHPWVDLRPNLRLQSVYDSEPVLTDAPIHVTKSRDFTQKHRIKVAGRMRADGTRGPDRWKNQKTDFREQSKTWGKVLKEGGTNALDIAQKIAMIEGYKYFNAEHSVPQYVFDREKKGQGDLHHLFTCEARANSIRGHMRFGEVPETEENRKGEGWVNKATEQFEPEHGKGAVARATLYFLLRYPGRLGDKPGEYTKADVETLVQWHKEDPVGLYELHRNQAIQEIQGNRNPLIDFPEIADQVDFSMGLGAWGREQNSNAVSEVVR
jgi:endonuclease G, mitochondrial